MNKEERLLITKPLNALRLRNNESVCISDLYVAFSRTSITLSDLEKGEIPFSHNDDENRSIEDLKDYHMLIWNNLMLQYSILDKIVTDETGKILKDIKPNDLTDEQIKKIDFLFQQNRDAYYAYYSPNLQKKPVKSLDENTKLSTINSVAETPRQAESGTNPEYQAYCDAFGDENKEQILSFEEWKKEQTRELMEKLYNLSMTQTDEFEPKQNQYEQLFGDDEEPSKKPPTVQQTQVQNAIKEVNNLLPKRPKTANPNKLTSNIVYYNPIQPQPILPNTSKLDKRINESGPPNLSVLGQKIPNQKPVPTILNREQKTFFTERDLAIQRHQKSKQIAADLKGDLANKKPNSQGGLKNILNKKNIGLPPVAGRPSSR